jgi:hypothetical protein
MGDQSSARPLFRVKYAGIHHHRVRALEVGPIMCASFTHTFEIDVLQVRNGITDMTRRRRPLIEHAQR